MKTIDMKPKGEIDLHKEENVGFLKKIFILSFELSIMIIMGVILYLQ